MQIALLLTSWMLYMSLKKKIAAAYTCSSSSKNVWRQGVWPLLRVDTKDFAVIKIKDIYASIRLLVVICSTTKCTYNKYVYLNKN